VTFLRAISCLIFLGLVTPLYAQGTQVAFGTIRQDTSAPIEVSADELNVDQETGAAVFNGNVVIGQGEMRLSAPKVLVNYRQDQAGIEQMEATGGVTLVSGQDAAESQRAVYSIDTGEIVMTGNVLLTQGRSAISSDRMTVNLKDGTARMQGSVKTILQTGDN
jgi:lipopolysaccharide export system protein LptA